MAKKKTIDYWKRKITLEIAEVNKWRNLYDDAVFLGERVRIDLCRRNHTRARRRRDYAKRRLTALQRKAFQARP